MTTPLFWKRVGLAFARAFIATLFVTGIPAWAGWIEGGYTGGKAVLLAVVSAAVVAGLRAAQIAFTQWETPPELKG